MALQLPRLPRTVAITDRTGSPAIEFAIWWDKSARAIEDAFNQLAETVAATEAAQASADSAAAAADDANTAAAAANSAADSVTAQANLTDSFPAGVTLGATDAGTNASASISAHTRVYADFSSVAVNAGSVTGLAYSTLYYIYYDDAGRTGGAVTYVATTSATTAAQIDNRHLVGSVTTPAGGGGATTGDRVYPPGVGNIP